MKFLVNETQFKKVVSKIQQELEYFLLNEGINEDRALDILKKNKVENPEEILSFLKKKDKSKNNKMLPALTLFYINARTNEEFVDVIKTFESLFNLTTSKGVPIPAPEIILTDDNKIKILNQTFSYDEFDEFKNFIEHYYFEEKKEDIESEQKLYDVNANKVFENDKFIIFEAPTPHVCIKLFGRDNKGRIYPERSFCIGAGTEKEPSTHYKGYRSPTGNWGITFYVVLDKEKYEHYVQTKEEKKSMLNVVGIRDCKVDEKYGQKPPFVDNISPDKCLSYFVWDENNPGPGFPVKAFGDDQGSVGKYIQFLEENGVNTSNIFKPKKFIDVTDEQVNEMINKQGTDKSDIIFKNLNPKQKFKFITQFAFTLTPYQIKFISEKMPKYIIEGFVKNEEKLGDINPEAFSLLSPSLQKTFINTKLIQLYKGSDLFTKDNFFKYIINDNLKDYAIKLIGVNLRGDPKLVRKSDGTTVEVPRDPVINKENTLNVLGLLSPETMLESFKGEKEVRITDKNFLLPSLPENFGDYVGETEELVIKNLDRIKSIPSSIGMAKNLNEFVIFNCDSLNNLPDSISQLSNLRTLAISKCDMLDSIPESIGQLSTLKSLTLHNNNNLKYLPNTIGNLKDLEVLNIIGTSLRSIPIDEIKSLPSLLHIGYDETTLTNLSDEEKEFIENFG